MPVNCTKHILHLQVPDTLGPSTVVVKIVKVSPATAPCRSPDSQHTVSILDPTSEARISFSAVYQPCNLLERPKVFHQDVLASLLAPESSQYAVRTALETFMAYRNQSAFPVLLDMFEDPLGLSEGLTILQMENSYNALLVALDANQDEDLLPPEGYIPAGPITPEGAPVDNAADLSVAEREALIQPPGLASARELLRIATTPLQQAVPLPAGAVIGSGPLDAMGAPRPEGQAGGASWGSKTFLLVWADTAEPVRLTPSVLLAHLILCSRREAGMFLRMASGLGFCQIGDYVASLFFLFRRRGHRLKCWECGVKKKAPCGQTQRDDLPWCCHRRLGEWIALHTITRAENAEKSITFQSNGKFFLSLLPPKKVLDAPEPVAAQLQFAPDQSEVVRLSEIMKDQPCHPSLTLQKALTRLAPTCRKLWNHIDWISGTVAQVVGERSEPAATKMHLWLERTAFYKVPKSHQDEVAEQCRKPFEQLIDELLPVVAGAPNLGGHNRSGESMKAAKAKQKMQQAQPHSSAAALAHRVGPASGNVAQVPDAGTLHNTMAGPDEAGWGQAPLLVRVGEGEGQPVCTGGPFAAPGLRNDPMGSDSQLHPPATSMPLGLEGWSGGQMPSMFGVPDGAASGSAPAAGQPSPEQGRGVQAGVAAEREYTVNGKRKPLSNTGQGRRRLNARAALRAAGQDKQPQTGPIATSPVPHPQLQPTPASTLPGRQPSLDTTENSSNRKSKAMAGAYSFTYSKMQAQGQLMHPSMQLALAEAAAAGNQGQDLLPLEADKAAAEAGLEAYRSALGMAGPEQLAAGPLAEGPSMQGSILPPPEALQGRRLRLGKKSKRGDRDGTDTESADEQAGSPLHVLSDVAHQEGHLQGGHLQGGHLPGVHLQAQPEATAAAAEAALAAVGGSQGVALPRMQTRHGGSGAALAAAGMGQAAQNSPRHRLQHVSRAEGPHPPAPTGPPAAGGSSLAGAAPLQEESATRASNAVAAGLPSDQATTSEKDGGDLRQDIQQGMPDTPRSSASAAARETRGAGSPSQGGIASRSKRQRTSRLGGAKKKVDRLNYLFEAIEADKASDSDTAHGTDSRGSQGEESDSARPLHHGIGDMRGEEAGPSGVSEGAGQVATMQASNWHSQQPGPEPAVTQRGTIPDPVDSVRSPHSGPVLQPGDGMPEQQGPSGGLAWQPSVNMC
ncbi:hypothetical protein ABBQ38_001625 [Trebouxia sp. C0009 RCD-2024]